MAQTNTVVIVGRLTRDPKADETTNGTAVCKIGVAVDRAGEGRGEEVKPGYFDVVSYGKSADAANRLLTKGSLVAVTGSLRFHQWKDAESDKTRNRIEIVGDIDFLEIKDAAAPTEEAGSEE